MYTKKLDNLPAYMKITREKENGIVYTPGWIINLMLDRIGYINNLGDKTIVDPACGDGNFLIIVVDRFLNNCKNNNIQVKEIKKLLSDNIFGFDIDETAVALCKKNLNDVALKHGIKNVNWNIKNMDGLSKKNINQYLGYFDYVVGNPPYIRIQHLGEERRKKIQNDWCFCKKGSTDIYIAFFEMGIQLLKKEGFLTYITPNTFFRTLTAEALRTFLMKEKIIRQIINFHHHQIFNKATTYSAITILQKGIKDNEIEYYSGDNKKNIFFIDKIKLANLNSKQWILTTNSKLKRIREIEKRGKPLGELANIHVGITTLADEFYIFEKPLIKDNKATITLKDKRSFIIEKDILKPIVKASVIKSSNEMQNRYVIFPYKKKNGKHVIIPEEELKEKYPLTYNYFLKIKERLLLRDKGKPNKVSWYAFGRSQGLDTSFGKKILTSPMNIKPRFIVWEKEEYTFFAGYCIKFDGDLNWLAKQLNSEDMEFYIKNTSRDYQNGYKSYSKTFISNFGITDSENKVKQIELFN